MPGIVTLLTTDHCPLCAAALDWLLGSPCMSGIALQTVDVASSEVLLERYGERVPVLRVGDQELDWPFSQDRLRRLLAGRT